MPIIKGSFTLTIVHPHHGMPWNKEEKEKEKEKQKEEEEEVEMETRGRGGRGRTTAVRAAALYGLM